MNDEFSTLNRRSTRRLGPLGIVLIAAAILIVIIVVIIYLATRPSSHSAGSSGGGKGTINLGVKNFAEEYIIADMYQMLLQKHGFSVAQHKLGTTQLLQPALLRGNIDLYPEYTGTGLTVVLGYKGTSNAAQAYNTLKTQYEKKYHLSWLDQSPMNDTNGVAVTAATASKYHLTTLSDLGKASSQLTFAGLTDCQGRPDCLAGLQNVYGAKFKNVTLLGTQTLIYGTLKSGQADAIEVFTTDAPIKANNLQVLTDNKGIFPADHIAPVVRDSVLTKYPEIRGDLNVLAPRITDTVMRRLNYQVYIKQMDPAVVAKNFLTSNHLI